MKNLLIGLFCLIEVMAIIAHAALSKPVTILYLSSILLFFAGIFILIGAGSDK